MFKYFLIIVWVVLIFYLYTVFTTPKVVKPEIVGRDFTPEELSEFDGSDDKKPVYICVAGKIYDVTAGRRHYGKGGSYNIFAGRCASRSFVVGCFDVNNKDCYNDKIDDFTPEQQGSLDHWVKFYANSDKYHFVGRMVKKGEEKPMEKMSTATI
jgi:predicted heme/steroid binding protein